jgi:hypothetical protein
MEIEGEAVDDDTRTLRGGDLRDEVADGEDGLLPSRLRGGPERGLGPEAGLADMWIAGRWPSPVP